PDIGQCGKGCIKHGPCTLDKQVLTCRLCGGTKSVHQPPTQSKHPIVCIRVTFQDIYRCQCCRNGRGTCIHGARMDDPCRDNLFHPFPFAHNGTDRIPTGDGFRKNGQIGHDVVIPLCSAQSQPKPRDHFIEDQGDTITVTYSSQAL